MYEQNALYLVAHSKLGAKNLNKICIKIVQKVPKWPLRYVIFWGSMPSYPTQPFLFTRCFKIILPEKICLKICENLVPPHWKKFWICQRHENIFKGPFKTSFLGLTFLYLVNIQSNSKFYPPYQNFLDPLPFSKKNKINGAKWLKYARLFWWFL